MGFWTADSTAAEFKSVILYQHLWHLNGVAVVGTQYPSTLHQPNKGQHAVLFYAFFHCNGAPSSLLYGCTPITFWSCVIQFLFFLPPSDSDLIFSWNCEQTKSDFFHIRSRPLAYQVLDLIHVRSLALRPLSEQSDQIHVASLTSHFSMHAHIACNHHSVSAHHSSVKINMEESNNSDGGQWRD